MSNSSDASGQRVALCVALAAFVFQFEAFQMVVALPSVTEQLGMTQAQGALTLVLYLLAATVTFIPAGRWADRNGLRKGFAAGAGILCAGALLCGLSPSAAVLLAARLVQGVGGGCLASLGYALIPARLPRERIGAAMGFVSFAAAAGLMTGAPVGGFLTSALSWRWSVLAVVPLAGVLGWVSLRYVPADPPRAVAGALPDNWAGVLLLAATLGGLLVGLGMAPVWGWRSARSPVLLLLAAAAGAALLVHERRADAPLIARLIWARRQLSPALATLFLVRAAVGGTAFLMPFYMERLRGVPASVSGLVLLGYTLTCALTGLLAGPLSDRIGSGPLVRVGTAVGLAACAGLAALAPSAGVVWVALLLAGLGVGTGLFFSPNSRFTMARAPSTHTGEVAALMSLALNTGSAIGVAAFSALRTALAAAGHEAGSYRGALALAAALFALAAGVGLFAYRRPREGLA